MSVIFSAVTSNLALACAIAGVVVFVSPIFTSGSIRWSVPFALDFWTAAGLLRLTGSSSWRAIGIAVLTIVIRKIATYGFKSSTRRSVIPLPTNE